MQAIRCPRGRAGANCSSTGSSSSGSSSSSRNHAARTLLHSSTWLGAAARRSALPLPALRICSSRPRSRVQGVPPLRDQQAHELPVSWRNSLKNRQTEADNAAASNGSNTREFSSNSGPVQSFQALFQGSGGSTTPRLASLRFSIVRAVEYGQKLRLVGSPECLGAWDAEQGPDMKWHEGHKWTAYAELAAGSHEFKFVVEHRSGEMEWEPGNNRTLEVPATAAEMQVAGQWGETGDTETLELLLQPDATEGRRRQQQLLEAAQDLKRERQQSREGGSAQQQQGRGSSSGSAAREEAAAAAKLLDSHNVQQYHKGLLVCVMMAAGVWEEGLLDIIRGSAMRATWRSYKAVWGDELMSELKQQLTTPQAVLAELQRSSSSSSADELACHVLWSLQELSTHSTRVALLLKQVYSGQEAAMMQQLAPGAGPQPCAAVLLRWMAAAAME
ncbi:hypothetical protein OEZ86_000465 [Tetradesmus obliquus]|nr:hypothetical protein OEZ86_000465 [Tetradesmus obliquus]